MSAAAPEGPSKNVALTVIGLMTILWGVAHAVLGSCLILSGDTVDNNLRPDDPAGGLAPLLRIMAGLMIMIGVVVLLLGVPGMLAGFGVLWRKQWGRILAFVFAVLVIMVGLLALSAYNRDAAGNATFIAFGAAEILYGILALVVLIMNGVAFVRPRV